jgi:hypothetical protein
MRRSASLLAAALLSLNCAATVNLPDATSAESPPNVPCEPTIARMVPPQFVIDHVVGGVQRPSSGPQPRVVFSPEHFASDKNFLGNELLWLALPPDGRVGGRSVSINTYEIAPSRIAVTARRTHGTPPATFSVERDENPGGGPRDRAVTMVFSAPGCWDITFTQGGKDLRFVLAVDGP